MTVDSTEREGTIELAARAMRLRDENLGRFVVASLPYSAPSMPSTLSTSIWTIR
jgi:hypothetical protein